MEKKRLSKSSIATIAIVCVLVAAFAVILPIYMKSNRENRALYQNKQIRITAYGKDIGSFTLTQLLELEGVSETEFSATYDTSNSEPTSKTYTGIELKLILDALDVDLAGARSVTFVASDGANKIYSREDVSANNNVYVAYKVNGNIFNEGIDPLSYRDKAEDGGPFVVIRVSNTYSQYRCKLLTEVIIA